MILLFSIDNRESFFHLDYLIKDFHKHTGKKNISKILVGTKIDLAEEYREVTYEEATQFAIDNQMVYFEKSSKKN